MRQKGHGQRRPPSQHTPPRRTTWDSSPGCVACPETATTADVTAPRLVGWTIARGNFSAFKNTIEQRLSDQPLIDTGNATLFMDVNGKVKGSLLIGDFTDKSSPIGQLSVTNSTDLSGTIYTPKKNAAGEYSDFDKLVINKDGATGTVSLGSNGYIKLDKGRFSGAQFTDGQMQFTIDKDGKITYLDTKTKAGGDYDPAKRELNIKVPGLGSFTANKNGFEIFFDKKFSLSWRWDKDLKPARVDGQLFLGGAGAVGFGYSAQLGLRFDLTFKHKELSISAVYGKNSIKFDGSYSWEGRRQPNPIQGKVGASLEVDGNKKTAQLFFEIKY